MKKLEITKLEEMLALWSGVGPALQGMLLHRDYFMNPLFYQVYVPVSVFETKEAIATFCAHIDTFKEIHGVDAISDENALAACIYAFIHTYEQHSSEIHGDIFFARLNMLSIYDENQPKNPIVLSVIALLESDRFKAMYSKEAIQFEKKQRASKDKITISLHDRLKDLDDRLKGLSFIGQFIGLFASYLRRSVLAPTINMSGIETDTIDQYINDLTKNPKYSEDELRLRSRNARDAGFTELADRIQENINKRFPLTKFSRLRNIITKSIFDAKISILSPRYVKTATYLAIGYVATLPIIAALILLSEGVYPGAHKILSATMSMSDIPLFSVSLIAQTPILIGGVALAMMPIVGLWHLGKNSINSALGLNTEENLDKKFRQQNASDVADTNAIRNTDVNDPTPKTPGNNLQPAQVLDFSGEHKKGPNLSELSQTAIDQVPTSEQDDQFKPTRVQIN